MAVHAGAAPFWRRGPLDSGYFYPGEDPMRVAPQRRHPECDLVKLSQCDPSSAGIQTVLAAAVRDEEIAFAVQVHSTEAGNVSYEKRREKSGSASDRSVRVHCFKVVLSRTQSS